MLIFTLQISIFCIIFIYLIHYLLNFFKENLTTPKTKDIVYITQKKYEDIFNIIKNNNNNNENEQNQNNSKSNSNSNNQDTNLMKQELKSFLKKQLKNNENDNSFDNVSSIDFLPSASSIPNYYNI